MVFASALVPFDRHQPVHGRSATSSSSRSAWNLLQLINQPPYEGVQLTLECDDPRPGDGFFLPVLLGQGRRRLDSVGLFPQLVHPALSSELRRFKQPCDRKDDSV